MTLLDLIWLILSLPYAQLSGCSVDQSAPAGQSVMVCPEAPDEAPLYHRARR